MMKSQLAGFRVLDVSQFLPGPYATQMLSDMGADVIKVEAPGGDPLRSLNPVTNERGEGPFHAIVNAGKRVVRIDLKSDDGIKTFEYLIRQTDVLVESYRPGVLDRLGFGNDNLRKLNPKMVHCALSGYGQTGPLRLRSGHDINYVAMSGGLHMTGPKDRPQAAFPPIADYAGAMQTVIAIQGALLGRVSSGQGVYLDVAMADTMVSWQTFGLIQQGLSEQTANVTAEQHSNVLSEHALGGAPERGVDLLNGGAACYQVYQTRDGKFISLGAIEQRFWENFCTAVNHPEWIERQLDPLPQKELIAELEKMFLENSRNAWDGALETVDCCYHPVLEYAELGDWPQIKDRQLIDRDPDTDTFLGVRFPVMEEGRPADKRNPMCEITPREALEAWS